MRRRRNFLAFSEDFREIQVKTVDLQKLALARQTAHGCHTRSSNWFRLLGGNTCILEGLSMCQLGGRRVGNEIDVDQIFM